MVMPASRRLSRCLPHVLFLPHLAAARKARPIENAAGVAAHVIFAKVDKSRSHRITLPLDRANQQRMQPLDTAAASDVSATAPAHPARLSGAVLWALGIIFAANFLNYTDRQLVSALENPLSEAFQLKPSQFGMLWTLFTVGYMLCAVPVGLLADRYSRTR